MEADSKLQHIMEGTGIRGLAFLGMIVLDKACSNLEGWLRSYRYYIYRRDVRVAKRMLRSLKSVLNDLLGAKGENHYERICEITVLSNGLLSNEPSLKKAAWKIHRFFTQLDYIYSCLVIDATDDADVTAAISSTIRFLQEDEGMISNRQLLEELLETTKRSAGDPFGPPLSETVEMLLIRDLKFFDGRKGK